MKENGNKTKRKYDLDNAFNYSDVVDSMIGKNKNKESEENIENIENKEIKRGRPKTTRVAEKGSQKGLQEGFTRKTFILKDELIERLDHFAWYERKSLKDIMNDMIEEYLKNHEK